MRGAEVEGRVREALNAVLDPCSIGRGVPAGLIDMGMIGGLELEPASPNRIRARITVRITSPGCAFGLHFDDQIRARLAPIEEIEEVEVLWNTDFDWSDDDMSDELKERLRRKRELILRQARNRELVSASVK
jgi:metal-sulfur cluster biosynthetic enzyme